MTDIKVIIPAFNEADSIAHVINELPKTVSEIIVVNNNSTDDTVKKCKSRGCNGTHRKQKRLWLCMLARVRLCGKKI